MMRRVVIAGALGLVLFMPAGIPRSPGSAAPASDAADSTSRLADPVREAAPGDSTRPDSPAGDSLAAVEALADSVAADSLAGAGTAPPRDYVSESRAAFTPENRAYRGTRMVILLVQPVLIVILMLLLLFSGAAARMRDIAHQLGHRRYVRVLVFLTLLTGVGFVFLLPIDWYGGFALEHQYGLSNQNFLSWITDELKVRALNLAFFGVLPILALAYGAIARRPRTWWAWLAAGSVPLMMLVVLLNPLVFEPQFNKVEPLADTELKREILDLAARAGIPGRHVFVTDRSRQSVKYNAYVSGFGASQRIVIYDTMLHGMRKDEILFVVGHEMGHYRLHHIWKSVVFAGVVGFIGFFLLAQLAAGMFRRFGERWHLTGMDDVATLPMYVIALVIVLTLLQPVMNGFSRALEHEADVFAVEVTRDNDAGARSFLALGSQNRSDPDPPALVKFWLYDHPPLAERIQFALDYRPWERGEKNRYFVPVR